MHLMYERQEDYLSCSDVYLMDLALRPARTVFAVHERTGIPSSAGSKLLGDNAPQDTCPTSEFCLCRSVTLADARGAVTCLGWPVALRFPDPVFAVCKRSG